MSSVNKVIIVGNLGKDPEMRFTPQGQAVTSFSVATSRKFKQGDEWKSETTWFRVSVWGNAAESANKNLKKGSRVLVEGRLSPDKETGAPRVYESNGKYGASYDVTADVVRFLNDKTEVAKNETVEDELPY